MNDYVTNIRIADGSIVKLESHNALLSTARIAKEYAKAGYPDRYVVFAEARHKPDKDGKFKGDVENGVFMSCVLRPSIFPSQASLMSSLASVALATALDGHTSKSIGIGWGGNIYCDGREIGHVTIEGKLDNFTSYEYMIVTFEAVLDKESFPPRINDLIKKVFESENTTVPIIIAKDILNKFFPFYSNIKSSSKFMNIYKEKFVLCGKKIKYLEDGKKKTFRITDIDIQNGALKIEGAGKRAVTVFSPSKVILPKKI